MANIIIVGGTAINLDHVVKAFWMEDQKHLTIQYDRIGEVIKHSGSSDYYRYEFDEYDGDLAEEIWDRITG